MLFFADAMLGKLTRWLRILGFDTEYSPQFTDEDILEKAKREGRVILTRDSTLHKEALRSGVKSILMQQDGIDAMLRELSPYLTENPAESRCPQCNVPLVLAEPGINATIPTHPEGPVWLCPSCGKLYWHGSHWEGIMRTLVLAGLGDRIGNPR